MDEFFLNDKKLYNNNFSSYVDPKQLEIQECTFNPQISKKSSNFKRKENTTDELYNDAKQRSENRE